MGGVELLRRAQKAGLAVCADGGLLRISGPKRLSGLAQDLMSHKAEILAALAPPVPPDALPESTSDSGAGAETPENTGIDEVSAPDPATNRQVRAPRAGDKEACLRDSLHIRPDRWEHREGKAYCPSCEKFMGCVTEPRDSPATLQGGRLRR